MPISLNDQVAHPKIRHQHKSQQWIDRRLESEPSDTSSQRTDVANTSQRQQEQCGPEEQFNKERNKPQRSTKGHRWEFEPDVGRVADGVSGRYTDLEHWETLLSHKSQKKSEKQ